MEKNSVVDDFYVHNAMLKMIKRLIQRIETWWRHISANQSTSSPSQVSVDRLEDLKMYVMLTIVVIIMIHDIILHWG